MEDKLLVLHFTAFLICVAIVATLQAVVSSREHVKTKVKHD